MSVDTESAALHFGATLHRAQAVLQRRLDERLGDWHGLNLADYLLLQALEQARDGLVLQALAKALLHPAAATLRQLQPMEKTGLLERVHGLVRLRPAGRQLLQEAGQTTQAIYAQALQSLEVDAAALASCQQLLERLELPGWGTR